MESSVDIGNTGSKYKVLEKWLVLDIQSVKDNVSRALKLIELSDKGENQFWGGNAFLVDFLKHTVIIKPHGEKKINIEYEFSKKEIRKELEKWLRNI